jgi:hypothetical protein
MQPGKLLRYTEKDFQNLTMEDWLRAKPQALRQLARTWFNRIKACGSDVQAIFHDGCPMACVDNTPFAYVNAFKAHVNIGFFYGAYLADETKLLQGTGRQMRHVKLVPESPVPEAAIRALIAAAYLDLRSRMAKTDAAASAS